MSKTLTRRDFLRSGLAAGTGVILAGPGLAGVSRAADAPQGVCVTLCNHWSYIGIGWQLGIESNVLSVTDAMEMADRPPHVKTCINLDARAYEFMAEKFPEVAQRLKKYLAEGKVELIGGSYGQPMGTMFGGESNIRQIVVGRETIRKALDYEMVTFLEEEEFTHPQIPQIVAGAGFRYASLAQVDTWGRAGCPMLEFNAIGWKGIDGTAIPTIPKNSLFGYSPDLAKLASSAAFKKLQGLGKPLIFTWEEFGWESPEQPSYLTAPAKYKEFAQKSPVEFVTCKQYLDKYGSNPKEAIYLPMDAWNKSLTWGLGGDQLRILDRKVEGLLLVAERFDAIASELGGPSQADLLDRAWNDLLASQSHDVGLCEYSRWQGDRMAPLERIEDYHNFTWGTIGYNHLDAARKQGQAALDAALGYIARRIDSAKGARGPRAITVFNPSGFERSDLVLSGRIYPIVEKAAGVIVRDRAGRVLPSQIVKADRDKQGNLVMAEIAFPAEKVPGVGYDTYYLEFTPAPALGAGSALGAGLPTPPMRYDEAGLMLENEHVKVRLDPATGGVKSLIDKRSGREALDAAKGAFPVLTGRPNPNLSLRPKPPANYDSSKSKALIDWVEKGPLRATVRARHNWPYFAFETRVTVSAGVPYVEVLSRILARVPPHSDAAPADIKEGYWFSLAPSFHPASVIRDFPLAIEPTQNRAFHALTFVDLVGKDFGLLLLHMGTQWFRRDERGVLSNLVMREWASWFDREYGWPIYAEYRHALMPHAGRLTNADRLRAASAFGQPLIARAGVPDAGDLPAAKGFVTVTPAGVQLSALRRKSGAGLEVRVVEVEGREARATVELGFPVAGAHETNLLGAKVADVARTANGLRLVVSPWKIRTFELNTK
jgi:alpha-mannosidase